jgi:hypothetical protein
LEKKLAKAPVTRDRTRLTMDVSALLMGKYKDQLLPAFADDDGVVPIRIKALLEEEEPSEEEEERALELARREIKRQQRNEYAAPRRSVRMVDHLACAQGYRNRAARCEVAAQNTTSTKFSECYRLVAQHYLMLANLEEDFVRRDAALKQRIAGEPPTSPSTATMGAR